MFDISFGELALCFIVALIVLGPEKLPKVARTVGRWAGQARGYMRNLTAELQRETEFMDIKRQLEEAQRELRDAGAQAEREMRSVGETASRDLMKPPPSLPP
ncbi:MAG: tatB [Panacagrimonas sp.]|jgi:sec-independent protein translocase protein TatB|nr:Sec-independent protein translocase protein TatB [Panacagrimonas sp.]MCC2656817.1 tatB [Panacagrimonas sp.]